MAVTVRCFALVTVPVGMGVRLVTVMVFVAVLVAMIFTPDLASQLYASLFCTAVVLLAYAARRRNRPAASTPKTVGDLGVVDRGV